MDSKKMIELIRQMQEQRIKLLEEKAKVYAQDSRPFANFEFVARSLEIPIEKVFLFMICLKVGRIHNYLSTQQESIEPIEDTLQDLAGYTELFYTFLKLKKEAL